VSGRISSQHVVCDSDRNISYNGWGVSVVDALDTMLLMGLEEEFDRALVHTARINLREVICAN
jgi:hypothetical protein